MADEKEWNDALPEGFVPEGELRLCVKADLLPDGSYGAEWLVVTDSQVYVVANGDLQPVTRLQFPFAEIAEPRVELLVDGGAFEIKHADKRHELLRFTAARSPRFMTAAQTLEKWLKEEEARLPEEELRRCPSCGFPLDRGSRVCPSCTPRSRSLRRLISYLRPHWLPACCLTLLAMVTTGLSLLPPWLNKPLMDQVLVPQGPPRPLQERFWLLGVLVAALLGSRLLGSALSAVSGWLMAYVGNRLTHDIRSQLYEHLHYLSLSFFDKRQLGSVISRVNQDTGQLQAFLTWGSADLVINVLLVVGIGLMLFAMNYRLALLVCVPVPLVVICSLSFWRRIRFYMHRVFHRWARLNSALQEGLSGIRVVRAFAQEPREVNRFVERSNDLAVTGVQAERVWSVLYAILSAIIMSGSMLVWYFGGRGVLLGDMTIGTLTAFISYVGMFYGPVQALSGLVNWSSRSLTAAERLFEVLDSVPEVEDAQDAVPMPHIEGRIEFRDVTFGYESHRPVLKKVSFVVEPGEMIGLVGHSGAGKTTIINLLCRFYDVNEGEILVDGVPLKKIRIADLRHQIGIVPQDTFLFGGTIAENIAYAKPGATREEIVRAAKIANAHDFILQKPDGYETILGEAGQGLSAGERQRLVIARAVLHNPRILILDEATSQVDIETEKQIQEAISRLVKGRTTFAIAHRLSTLRNADRLIVLKAGEIQETGTHDELLHKKRGEFARLVGMYQAVSKVHEVQR
ncbi:MAG: ATP-binding cassette domain-containing protein [Armatimonadetes bacterium]|nr:ATP-binding cassette domain-containing protein [Armatimonadota bacterium]